MTSSPLSSQRLSEIDSGEGHPATRVHLRMHPRVFAALGADLVTSDVVAVIELVKNSYDAYANGVWIRLGFEDGEQCLEIEDDGQGMTEAIIRDVWCLVATPYKEENRTVARDGATRRVSGAKGLGRLSVGRLGERLTLLTKARGHPCWQVDVNWTDLAASEDLNDSTVELRRQPSSTLSHESGTLLRIHALRNPWSGDQCEELKHNLERLISPFGGVDDFQVQFSTAPSEGEQTDTTITSPRFLSEPKYRIHGEVDDGGNITARYRYSAINTHNRRERELTVPWRRIYRSANSQVSDRGELDVRAKCGPFSFDIRAWDISAEGTQEIANRYGLQKRRIRAAIRANKGISVYRDGVLVLPKSESARDWLGLDLRRVSQVGSRMSTNQLVGYVSITADGNPGIQDTSDRERLAVSDEVSDFQIVLKTIVEELEKERDGDRAKYAKEIPMADILSAVSADDAFESVRSLAEAGMPASKAVPVIRNLNRSLARTRENIERRFVYYSRLATVGTVAQMLVHEIRNRTTAIGRFLRKFEEGATADLRERVRTPFKMARNSVEALERLADVFAPLASRSFKRGSRTACLEDRVRVCLDMQEQELLQRRISCSIPDGETAVAVDPGELDAVILNLVTNSIYWLSDADVDKRVIEFHILESSDPGRVEIRTLDTGPGIQSEDLERVFWPGVTRKPSGIGMGLTVASEIVAAYDGQMAAVDVDTGACFVFDLPLVRTEGRIG